MNTTALEGWDSFDARLARHGKTKVENNTWLQRDTAENGQDLLYTVVLHETAILTFNRTRGTVTLDSGGYATRLTLRRLNTYLDPFGLEVLRIKGVWFVHDRVQGTHEPFVDGMLVDL